jgi:hypothetical protein
MERWFDLHLYLANWGSRRLMIRLPTRMVNRDLLDALLGEVDCAGLTVAGENLILDIVRDEVESEDLEDGSGWLASLTPLRAEVLAGDLRLFYRLWLTAVDADTFEADEPDARNRADDSGTRSFRSVLLHRSRSRPGGGRTPRHRDPKRIDFG